MNDSGYKELSVSRKMRKLKRSHEEMGELNNKSINRLLKIKQSFTPKILYFGFHIL